MAYTKRNTTAHQEAKSEDIKEENIKEAPVKKAEKKYKPDDVILCHSMYPGTLLFSGNKSKMTYEFSNMGDTRWIEYQDLLAALLMKKKSLFAPYIIIDDDELLEDRHWEEIKRIYDGMFEKEDLMKIISLPTHQFETEFKRLPIGFKNTIASIVSEMITQGTFDSMNKIKIIDEECGTDLKLYME